MLLRTGVGYPLSFCGRYNIICYHDWFIWISTTIYFNLLLCSQFEVLTFKATNQFLNFRNLSCEVKLAWNFHATLRPYTWGKRFLLFLPDSHSAYYDSFVSALGWSLPPSLGLSRICCTWSSFWRKRWVGRGGWVVGSPTHTCNTW